MRWLDVDGVRDYLAECGRGSARTGRERRPSRKVVYRMVKNGLRVARTGDTGRRFLTCSEWVDEFLIARADASEAGPRPIEARRPA
jgi:hypothetical protein